MRIVCSTPTTPLEVGECPPPSAVENSFQLSKYLPETATSNARARNSTTKITTPSRAERRARSSCHQLRGRIPRHSKVSMAASVRAVTLLLASRRAADAPIHCRRREAAHSRRPAAGAQPQPSPRSDTSGHRWYRRAPRRSRRPTPGADPIPPPEYGRQSREWPRRR